MSKAAATATARPGTLAEVEAAVWRELQAAVKNKQHPWRVAVLATVQAAADGVRPEARSVILRHLDEATQTLLIYTDSRSAKVRQAQQRPQGVLVMWSPLLAWQLRLNVALQLRSSGLQVSSRWAQLKLTPAAQDYMSPLAPGSPLSAPQPERSSRDYFAILEAQVKSADWLELHPDGHRRARFDAEGARWITP